ncbi:MAG: 6-phosphogluconolactonase [Bacteroidales bacterium]|nr:6-phosphogluconolactonase [Bacteroidales bacterium]
MKPDIRIFTEPEIMATSLSEEFYRYVNQLFNSHNSLNVALSGGNTPLLFFTKLAEYNGQKLNKIDWKRIHFFWGDERCVPTSHEDSNYGRASEVFLSTIDIPEKNIHRINGENDPYNESERYSQLVRQMVNTKSGIPSFDWVFLGVGTDGHIASIFPDQIKLINSEKICEVSENPESKQKRVTLTGIILNNAKRITFIVTGDHKKNVVKNILNNEGPYKKYPASYIKSNNGVTDWYLDSKAADLI